MMSASMAMLVALWAIIIPIVPSARDSACHLLEEVRRAAATACELAGLYPSAVESLESGPLSPLRMAGGTTGSTFLITKDHKWIIKSMRLATGNNEKEVLLGLLGAYKQYIGEEIVNVTRTLLPSIAGQFDLAYDGKMSWYVVRALPPSDSEADCKGLSSGALGIVEFFQQQQDLELTKCLEANKDELMAVFNADMQWLESGRGSPLVDWSLLVKYVPHSRRAPPLSSKCFDFTEMGLVTYGKEQDYVLGWIDILSELNGVRLEKDQGRGAKWDLPCGKFQEYSLKQHQMLEMLMQPENPLADACAKVKAADGETMRSGIKARMAVEFVANHLSDDGHIVAKSEFNTAEIFRRSLSTQLPIAEELRFGTPQKAIEKCRRFMEEGS